MSLVPYIKEIIPIYHKWLQDPYIQEMTCTEASTIEEENVNWKSYLTDSNKFIFIIVDMKHDH